MTLSIDQFLSKVTKLPETPRYKSLLRNKLYFEGRQYESRPLDINGFVKGNPGVTGSMCSPSWDRRDPGPVWNLRRTVVEELTSWSVGGDSWCSISVPDDPEADSWLKKVIEMCSMPDAMADARDVGGSQGAAIVSFAVRDGEVSLETHEPVVTWVLEWADVRRFRPRVVAKVFLEDDQFSNEEKVDLETTERLCVRVWTDAEEIYYKRERDSRGDWLWSMTEKVAHNLGFCPVYWCPQGSQDGASIGKHDGENTSKQIDQANYLCSAGDATTKRNANDTLVVREDPSLRPAMVHKGAMGAIFARGGAEYLSQNGDSARACWEGAKERAEQVYQASGVVILTKEELGGDISGEAMRRRFAPMAKKTSKIRTTYGKRLIVPLCQGLLEAGRRLLKSGFAIMVEPDEDTSETAKAAAGALGVKVVALGGPGTSSNIKLSWPDPFPPTFDDKSKAVDMASKGFVGGVLSLRTAVEIEKSAGLPILDVEEEIEAIEGDKEKAAEMQAKAIGVEAEINGNAGAIGEKDETGDEE